MSTMTGPDAVEIREEGRAVDGAQRLGTAVFHPHRVRPLRGGRDFRLGLEALAIGPLTVGTIEYTQAARIDTGPLDDSYQVNMPLEGTLRTSLGDEFLVATPTHPALYRRDVPTAFEGFENGQRVLAVKFDRQALDARLRLLGGSPPAGGIRFGPVLDTATPWGRVWLWHLGLFVRQLRDPGVLLRHPLLAGAIMDQFLTSLLLAAAHPDRELLEVDDGPQADAPTVRRIAALMRDSPELHFGGELLGELSGATPRAVQQGFHRHFGVSPHEYLRTIRLDRVHAELGDATARGSIAAVARSWGFGHPGRFSADYARRFGERPSATQERTRGIRNAKVD